MNGMRTLIRQRESDGLETHGPESSGRISNGSASKGNDLLGGTAYGEMDSLFIADDSPRIDGRFLERREHVARAAFRQRSRQQLIIGAVLVVLVVFAIVAKSGLFAVRVVDVTGTSQVEADVVRRAAAIQGAPSMFNLDDAAIVRRVTSISEIGSAQVVLHWPNRVEIKVVELRPVGVLIESGGQAATVASNGRVLAHVGVAPKGLPQISGIAKIPADGSVVAPQTIAAVAELMPASLRQNLVVIDAGDVAGVVVRLHDVEIRLGRIEQRDDVALKLNAAAAVLEQANPCRKYVDVSVAYAPVAGC